MPSFGEEAFSLLLSPAVMYPLRFPFISLLILVLLVNTKHLRKPACCEQHIESAVGEMVTLLSTVMCKKQKTAPEMILAENQSAWHPQML